MQKKIRIAYIIDELNIGGTEKQLVSTIELINKNQFEVFLVCLRPSDYFSRLDIQCEKLILNVYSLLSFNGFLKFCRLVFYLRKRRIDIVQTYFFDSTVFGVLAARIAGVKVIISCKRDLGFWYTSKLLRVLKLVNIFVHRYLVNSNAVKEHTAKYECVSCAKIDVIYNGIETEVYDHIVNGGGAKKNFDIRDDDYIVGIVANLNRPVKRVDVFIKAAAEVLENKKNVKFVIVGDGYLKGDLKKLSEGLIIEKKVIFTGLVEDVSPYISLFDVGVLCSDSEGFSNSILEYMASGIPVVATDAGGNKELIEQGVNGVLVVPGDYESMAEQICALLNDRRRRLQTAENAKSLIRREYSWNVKMKEIETYYHSLVYLVRKGLRE